ncbi:hypothetical protein AB0C59_24345 [Streptomyces sp. NPDC048664]|uniref:hypothetical protein n=1 Tax=Streptomyces sp. NPDC048664 TaxID=3154505 RepID=UPI003441545D
MRGRRRLTFQVGSRLSWSFSARAGLGRRGRAPLSPAVRSAGVRASLALLRSVLRAGRARPCPPPPVARRRRRALRR